LAQLITLAAHGSAWLAGRTGEQPPELKSTNSTFQYVREIRFELGGSLLGKAVVANDVPGWLQAMRRRGATRLWLAIPDVGTATSDRKVRAFLGPRTWFLVATHHDRPTEVWRANWTVGDREALDRRIWDVEYRGHRTSKVDVAHVNPADAMSRLVGAIENAQAFASSQDLDDRAAVFGAALQLGQAADPIPPFHPDMFPVAAFGRSARHLLAMATRAYVFGGMGSWNDLAMPSPSATDSYEQISAELHAAVLTSFVAAVNGSIER
jgi:hypothetical protein